MCNSALHNGCSTFIISLCDKQLNAAVMFDEVVKHVPSTWKKLDRELVLIDKKGSEYLQLVKDFKTNRRIRFVERVQNVNRYGQYLLRQQQLAMTNPGEQYYRVQQYVVVDPDDVDIALKYQIDPRRCDYTDWDFHSSFPYDYDAEVVFVVSAVTCEPHEEFSPSKDSDFYIKYVVYLD